MFKRLERAGVMLVVLAAMGAVSLSAPTPVAAIEEVNVCPPSNGANDNRKWYVNFATGKAEINNEDRAQLRESAKQAKGAYIQVICIIGTADKRGSPEANKRLSLQRARAVADYLVSQGVKSNTLYISARGEAFGENLFGSIVSAEDRRVEVRFVR